MSSPFLKIVILTLKRRLKKTVKRDLLGNGRTFIFYAVKDMIRRRGIKIKCSPFLPYTEQQTFTMKVRMN